MLEGLLSIIMLKNDPEYENLNDRDTVNDAKNIRKNEKGCILVG